MCPHELFFIIMSISELPCSYCDSTASTYCGDNATQMPCVQWGTIFIAEPATMITDYLVGAACLCSATLLGVQHMRSSVPRAHTTLCWALGFGLLGASFVLAGSEHGFAVYTLCHGVRTCRFTSPLWIVSMILAVMAPSSMVCAYVPLRRPWTRRQQLSLLLPVFMTPIYSAVLLSGAAAGTRELMAFNTMVLFLAPVMIELFVQCFIAYRRASLMRDDTPVALIAQRWLASGLALVLVAQVSSSCAASGTHSPV